MAKRPADAESTQLTSEILVRLSKTRLITIKELHEQLAASGIQRTERSIQRAMVSLAKRHLIHTNSESKPYGYRLDQPVAGLIVGEMTLHQALLLTLAERQLNNFLPPNLRKSMQNFFVEARRKLAPDKDPKPEAQWLAKVRVVRESQALLPPPIKEDVLDQIGYALFSDSYLSITYRNIKGQIKKSMVMPLGLVQQGVCLYLVCRFEGYEDERNLAIHRFLYAHTTNTTFSRPKEFDLQKYEDDGRFGFGKGVKTRLCFDIRKTSGAHLIDAKLSKDQVVEDLGDWYRIRATVVDTMGLDWWLRGFGDRVRDVVKEPV